MKKMLVTGGTVFDLSAGTSLSTILGKGIRCMSLTGVQECNPSE